MDRALTDRERAILVWMLDADLEGYDEYRAQIDGLRARGACGCGCPSIDFVAPGTGLGYPLPREGWIRGEAVGIAVFAKDGQLTGIEQTDYMSARSTFPDPAELIDTPEM